MHNGAGTGTFKTFAWESLTEPSDLLAKDFYAFIMTFFTQFISKSVGKNNCALPFKMFNILILFPSSALDLGKIV